MRSTDWLNGKICMDMDGVLADFTEQFAEAADFRPVPRCQDIVDWHWRGNGMTQEQTRAGWARVTRTVDFWQSLRPLLRPRELVVLRDLVREHKVVFVTNRSATAGGTVEQQSKRWLADLLGTGYDPVVVPTGGSKAEVCASMGLTVAIDDAPHTLEDLADAGIRAYAMSYPYNQHVRQVQHVNSLYEFFVLEGL